MNFKYFHGVSATVLLIADKDDNNQTFWLCILYNFCLIVGTKQACFLTKSVRYDGMPESVRQLIDKFEVPDEVNKL